MKPRTRTDTMPGAEMEHRALFAEIDKMMVSGAIRHAIDDLKRLTDARDRADRRQCMLFGGIPGSIGAYPHTVPLRVDMVDVDCSAINSYNLVPHVEEALTASATGDHHLWFDDQGDAFMSFENEVDAMMFRLTIVGAS